MIQLVDKIVETMLSGQIYDPGDGILAAMQSQRFVLLRRYNDLDPADMEGRARLLSQMFRSFGEGSYIEQPLHANWAGMFCDIGLVVDSRTSRLIIVSAIDNLCRGASGQAIANANLMCGLPVDCGLNAAPMLP